MRVRPWARRLCFSEWNLEPETREQVAHLLAVLIQGQVEAYKTDSASNVRTPFSRDRLRRLLDEAGWSVAAEATVDSTPLQDADWEIQHCLRSTLAEAESLPLPSRLRDLLESEVDTLRRLAKPGQNPSLSSYAILAQRAPT
jgi:hypothetical protein